MKQVYNTGVDYALTIVGGKWKPVIIFLLAGHSWRTGELEKQLGISSKVLSQCLHDLTEAGLVARKSFATIPPHVEYSLTPSGEDLYAAMRYLNFWGETRAKSKGDQVKIMCTDKMHQLGIDGVCAMTKEHLKEWKKDLHQNQ